MPVFLDAGLIILIPLAFSLAKRTKRSVLYYVCLLYTSPLFTGSSTAGQAALAALLPNTFLQALVWRTLTASALPEVTEDEGL